MKTYFRPQRGYRGHGDVGAERAEPDVVRQADRHGRRGRQHQDPHRGRHQVLLGQATAVVPVLMTNESLEK